MGREGGGREGGEREGGREEGRGGGEGREGEGYSYGVNYIGAERINGYVSKTVVLCQRGVLKDNLMLSTK